MCIFKKPWIEVTVCAVSRLLPNLYCPFMIRQKFRKDSGNEPTKVCAFHVKPPDPPEPTTWRLVCEQTGDLVNQWCPNPVNREYPESQVPTFVCTVHAEPMVTKKICKDTGNLINPFCPNPIDFSYPQSQVPTVICYIHKEPLVKVTRPWPEFAPEFLVWSPLCGDGLVYDPQVIDERQLDELRAVMAADGIAVTRDFAWGTVGPGDPTNGRRLLPWTSGWAWNEDYWAQLDRRLGQWCLRDGTYIISVLDACSFYADSSFKTNPLREFLGDRPQDVFLPGPARTKVFEYAIELFRRTRKYHPRVIIQTRNEGLQLTGPDNLYGYDHALITLLKQAGMPVENIMIGYYDSSLCARTLLPETWTDPETGEVYHGVDLMGRGLSDAHNIGSPECIENSGAEARRMMSWGALPSCDGPDREGKAAGLGWYWAPGQALRPTAAQAKRIVQIMKGFGYPRFEYWSSVALQDGWFPNLAAAITHGRAERQAMQG